MLVSHPTLWRAVILPLGFITMSPPEFSNSEETETDTDMHTLPSEGTELEEVFEPTALPRTSIQRNCCRPTEDNLLHVKPKIHLKSPSSSSVITHKPSKLSQSFHFATGLVTFSWLLYFLWNYMHPDESDLNPESLITKFSQLPLYTYLLSAFIISIVSTAVITGVSMAAFKIFENQAPPKLHRLQDFPKLYTSSDPAQRELKHTDILEEFNHGSMRPQTPYNYTPDSKPIVDARGVYKNTESGMDFLDGFYHQRIRKFKKTLEEQQEMLEKIRTKQKNLGLDEKNIPQYMLCSPCYDHYNCNRVHFDYNGYRYHCQPYDEDFGETRRKMSKVKIYKDNVLGKPSQPVDKPKNMSAPNDFPGRDLHSFISKKFPPFADDFDLSKRPELTKHEVKLAPPNPFRKSCPRKDPCIYCRSINPPHTHDNSQPQPLPTPTEDARNDCNGNTTDSTSQSYKPSKTDCRCALVNTDDPVPGGKKAVAVGPNILYVNYNFDYQNPAARPSKFFPNSVFFFWLETFSRCHLALITRVNMFKPRPCGCKGIRTCLVCEAEFGVQKVFDETNQERCFEYCYLCGNKAYEGSNVARDHGHHKGEAVEYPGVLVVPDFVTKEEELFLAEGCDRLPWDLSQSGRRKQNFGPKTNFKKKKINGKTFNGFPEFGRFVQNKLNEVKLLEDFQTIEQCAIEYRVETGACIDPHIDDCWVWGERVISVSLLSDSVLTMTKYSGPSTRYNLSYYKNGTNGCNNENCSDKIENFPIVRIPMPARSLLVLYGPARYEWEHCIYRNDVTGRRICMAYREFTPEYLEGGEHYEDVGVDILNSAKNFWDCES
ncbi:unnamed protein product [Allacma fusca]|uniref:Uncharacterized protein n=1 Tax=Allacma fusca TaxID=39272 RepID=A0A8J2LPD7_9HEXA|nr:unnamed protein product [Allacma fusca]